MAAPDTYSGVGAIYAGRFPPMPDWRPAAGTFDYISPASGPGHYLSDNFDLTNPQPLLRDADGTYILDAWNSTAQCADGTLAFGGGHHDRMNNAVHYYDRTLQMWSRIVDATPLGIEVMDDNQCYGNIPAGAIANSWGEYWTDSGRTAVKEGKPGPPHTYGNFKWVPGSAFGNTKGAAVLMGGFSYGAHCVDLDNLAAGWQRCGDLFTTVHPTTKVPGYGCTIWDSLRSRLFCYPSNGGGQDDALILNFPSRTVEKAPGNFIDSYYQQGRHAVADDLYLVFGNDSPNYPKVKVLHPTSGAKYTPPQSGDIPPPLYTMEWDETRRRLVGWGGTGTTLWFGQAPADMRTGTWVWTSQSFTAINPAVPQAGTNGMYDRLHHDPVLDIYTIVTRVSGPVQCWGL